MYGYAKQTRHTAFKSPGMRMDMEWCRPLKDIWSVQFACDPRHGEYLCFPQLGRVNLLDSFYDDSVASVPAFELSPRHTQRCSGALRRPLIFLADVAAAYVPYIKSLSLTVVCIHPSTLEIYRPLATPRTEACTVCMHGNRGDSNQDCFVADNQASDQVQDQIHPGIATRKASWEESRGNDVPAAALDDPAGLVERSSTSRSVAKGTADTAPARDRPRGQKPPSSGQSTPRRPSISSSSTTSRAVDGATADQRGDTSDDQARFATRSSAASVGQASHAPYPDEQILTHGEQSRRRAGDGDVGSLKEHGNGPRPQETSTSAPSVLRDGSVHVSNSRQPASSGHPGGDEGGVEHALREQDDQRERYQPRHFSTPSISASTAAQEIAAALVEGTGTPGGESFPPEEEAQREGNDSGNSPRENAEAAEQIKDVRFRDPVSPNVENTAAPTTERRKSLETRRRRATETGSVTEMAGGGAFTNERESDPTDPATEADSALSDGGSDTEDGRSRAVRQVTTGRECHDEDTLRGENPRTRSRSAEGSGTEVAEEQDHVAQQESEKPFLGGGKSRSSTETHHHSRNSRTGEGGHHEESRHQPQNDANIAVNGGPGLASDKLSEEREVRKTKLPSSSNNRDLLQSPPMLSRRKASDTAVSDRKLRLNKAVSHSEPTCVMFDPVGSMLLDLDESLAAVSKWRVFSAPLKRPHNRVQSALLEDHGHRRNA